MGFLDAWRSRKDRQPQTLTEQITPQGVSLDPHAQALMDKIAQDAAASFIVNPAMMAVSSPYLESPYGKQQFSSMTLRQVATLPWVRPIIKTVKTHIKKFGHPADHPGDYGFEIVLKDKSRVPDESTRKTAREIEEWVMTCGTIDSNSWEVYTRDSFADFLGLSMQDSLILDGAAWEIRNGKNGVPEAWSAVDAGTIFKTKPANPKMPFNPTDAAYTQIVNGKPVAHYGLNNLAYIIRNKDTDINKMGYGSPELLDVARIVLNILMAYDYNQKFFQQGGPAGLLIGTNIPREQFDSMVRQLRYVTSGVANAHRLPSVSAPEGADLKWLQLSGYNNKEMGYYDWILMNMKFVAANYQVALEETGFYMGREGEGGSFVQSNDFEAKIRVSQSKCLSDGLDTLEDAFNKYILTPHSKWGPHKHWGDFKLKFVGLESKSNSDRADLANKLTKSWTVDEVRTRIWGMEPLPDGKGEIILDTIYQTNAQMIEAAKNPPVMPDGQAAQPAQQSQDWNYSGEAVEKAISFDL